MTNSATNVTRELRQSASVFMRQDLVRAGLSVSEFKNMFHDSEKFVMELGGNEAGHRAFVDLGVARWRFHTNGRAERCTRSVYDVSSVIISTWHTMLFDCKGEMYDHSTEVSVTETVTDDFGDDWDKVQLIILVEDGEIHHY